MADIKKTVEIIFGAIDNTGGTLTGIGENIDSATKNIGNITGPLASVTKGLFKTEAAVIALAAAYGGFAISKAVEFENAQIDLAKVLDATDPKIESFTSTVIALSEEYGVASGAILQGIANFKQAGFTAEESALLQRSALDLIIAGDVEAKQATEILVASLKGFGAQADESTRFIEALNNVSNVFATDLGELAAGMARISPVASKMGFTFEETTGLVTPIIEVFRSGPEAANALRTGLLKLIDDAKPVGEALATIGVSQRDANGTMRSGKDIFLDVATAFKTLDENQKLVITSQLVGTEQAARMVVVFDNLSKVQEITRIAMQETGSVTDEVALRLASANKQIDITAASFNNLAAAVGKELLPSFGSVAGGTQEILQAFRQLVTDGGLDPLFNQLDAQGVKFSAFLSDVAKALPDAFAGLDFSGLVGSFGTLRDSVSGLFGGLDLTTASGLQEVLQNLVDFITLLTNASAGAVDGLSPLIDGVTNFLQVLAESDGSTQGFIGTIGGIATAIDTVLPLLNFLGIAILTVGSSVSALAGLKAVKLFKDIGLGLSGISPTNIALASAIGAVTFAVDANITAYKELQQRNGSLADSQLNLANNTAAIEQKLKNISAATGVSIKSIEQFNIALDNGSIILDDSTAGYAAGSSAITDYGVTLEGAVDTQTAWADSVSSVTDVLGAMGIAVDGSALSLQNLEQQQKNINIAIEAAKEQGLSYNVVIEDGVSRLVTWGDANDAVSNTLEATAVATGDLTDRQKLAIEQTNKMELQLEQLASNEKIASIEFTAQIRVADIQAQAAQVVAAFDTIAQGISSANQASTSLLSLLADPNLGSFDKLSIESAAKEAQAQAKKQLELEEKLVNAQVENLDAKTKLLASGAPDIVINADNLAPELQQVLRSLIDNIRIEAIDNGLEILQ